MANWKKIPTDTLHGKTIEGVEAKADGHVYLTIAGKTYWIAVGELYEWIG